MSPNGPRTDFLRQNVSFDLSQLLQLLSLDGYSGRTNPWGEIMRRREFIGLIGTISVWPRNLVAQPADQFKKKMPRIGFLASVPHERIDAFDRGLREHGYSDGENIIIERRFWKNDPAQLAKFAAELVALDVEVIVAPTTPEALAAKALTSTIPIVTATA